MKNNKIIIIIKKNEDIIFNDSFKYYIIICKFKINLIEKLFY